MRLISSITVVALLVICTILYFANATQMAFWASDNRVFDPASADPQQFDDYPAIKRFIKWHPIDPIGVNNLYVLRRGAVESSRSLPNEVSVIRRLGYRYTPAILNQMTIGAELNDIELVLDNAEALLKRNRLVDQAFAVLSGVESETTFHAHMVGRLADLPSWRSAYFARPENLINQTQVNARFLTFSELQATSAPMDSSEVRALVRRLTEMGEWEKAYSAWNRTVGNKHKTAYLFPPMAKERDSVPFEWTLEKSANHNSSFDGSGLMIRYTGEGLPIFASQMIKSYGSAYRIKMNIESPADIDRARKGIPVPFEIRWRCPNQLPIYWSGFSRAGNSLSFASGSPACEFPTIEIVASRQVLTGKVRFILRSMALEPRAVR